MNSSAIQSQLAGYLQGSKQVFEDELVDDNTKIPESIDMLLSILESKGNEAFVLPQEGEIEAIVESLNKGTVVLDITPYQALMLLTHYLTLWPNPILSHSKYKTEEQNISALIVGIPYYTNIVAIGVRMVHNLSIPKMILLGRTLRVIDSAIKDSGTTKANKNIFLRYLTPILLRDSAKNVGEPKEEEIRAIAILLEHHTVIFNPFLDSYPLNNSSLLTQYWTPQSWIEQHGTALREFIDIFQGSITKKSIMEEFELTEDKINDVFRVLKESQAEWSVYEDIVCRPWSAEEERKLLAVLIETGGFPEYIVEKIPSRTTSQIQKKLELITANSANRETFRRVMEGRMEWEGIVGLQLTISRMRIVSEREAAKKKETSMERNRQEHKQPVTTAPMGIAGNIFAQVPKLEVTPTPISALATRSTIAPVAQTVVTTLEPTTPLSMMEATPVSVKVAASKRKFELDDNELDESSSDGETVARTSESSSHNQNPPTSRVTRSSNIDPEVLNDTVDKPNKLARKPPVALTPKQKEVYDYLDANFKMPELRIIWSTLTDGLPVPPKCVHKPQLVRQLVLRGYQLSSS